MVLGDSAASAVEPQGVDPLFRSNGSDVILSGVHRPISRRCRSRTQGPGGEEVHSHDRAEPNRRASAKGLSEGEPWGLELVVHLPRRQAVLLRP